MGLSIVVPLFTGTRLDCKGFNYFLRIADFVSIDSPNIVITF